jgi:thiol:disulfide interchange protein DsbD
MKVINCIVSLLIFSNISYGGPVETGHANVSIIKSDSSSLQKNELFIGIKMDMQKNWHTYWKNPGDSGGPINVAWTLPKNVKIEGPLWPTPQLLPYPPLMTYGYKDFVIFPYKIQYKDINDLTFIGADIDFLICADVCVPEKANIKSFFENIEETQILEEWISKVPNTIYPVLGSQTKRFLEIRFSYNDNIENIYFFLEKQNIVLHSGKQVLIKEENNWLLKIPLQFENLKISSIEGVIKINEDSYLVKADVTNNPEESISMSIFQAIIFAFIGGIILNLMPCVFPIISLKILSFVSMGGSSKKKIRTHSLIFSFGVIISFISIALALLAFKAGGNSVGWGFQLQSPLIVGILSILMFIIGLILLMNIEIGTSMTKLGKVGMNQTTYSSSFLTGILAVVVASPCTAPFMGAAIGYALIQPSFVTLPIFIALGTGFAFPYLILSYKPELVGTLPGSGEWMLRLKEFFAFPMFATSLWLLWVFSLQTSADALVELLLVLLLISTIVWLITNIAKKIIKIILLLALGSLLITQIQTLATIEIGVNDIKDTENEIIWTKKIEEELQAENKPYLINYTAAWCITCQANDKVALSRPGVKKFFKENNIKYIVADWTNKNQDILDALKIYGRSGVPLYVYWKPGMQKPEILPALLTENIILDALK